MKFIYGMTESNQKGLVFSPVYIERMAFFAISLMIFYSFLILLSQNFILSEQFDLLPLREVDDFAFQHTLRNMHEAWLKGQWFSAAHLNDYGYGAIFWLPQSLITFPGFLLQQDQWVILVPRLISLSFGYGALWVLWKIGKLYTNQSMLSACVPFVMLLQPEFAFICLRFHNHAQLFFFSCLAFYQVLLMKEEKDFWKPTLAVSLAVGTKINSLIIFPALIVCFCFFLIKKECRNWQSKVLFYSIVCAFLSLFFYNPLILFFPMFHEEAVSAIKNLISYIVFSSKNPGDLSNENWHNMIQDGLFYNYADWLTMLLVLGTIFFGFHKKREDSFHQVYQRSALFFFGIWSILGALIFLFRVKQGPFAYANYILPVAAAIPLGVLFLERFGQLAQIFYMGLIVSSLFLMHPGRIESFYFRYQQTMKKEENILRLKDYETIKKIFESNPGVQVNVLTDYRVLLPASVLTGQQREDFYDNFYRAEGSFQYIVLHKDNPMFWDPKKIHFQMGSPENYLYSHQTLKKLLNEGIFQGGRFSRRFENERIIFFGRE